MTRGTIWLVLATAATVAIGVFVFYEKLTLWQWLGVFLALVALLLLNSENCLSR